MRAAFILIFIIAGCGVKGAPMPRRDEAFIKPSVFTDSQKPEEPENKKLKTTFPYKEDPR